MIYIAAPKHLRVFETIYLPPDESSREIPGYGLFLRLNDWRQDLPLFDHFSSIKQANRDSCHFLMFFSRCICKFINRPRDHLIIRCEHIFDHQVYIGGIGEHLPAEFDPALPTRLKIRDIRVMKHLPLPNHLLCCNHPFLWVIFIESIEPLA